MSRRSNRKRRQLKKSVYIVCEGKNTEPIYFQGIKEQAQSINHQYAFEIILVDTPKTDPIGLVNEAKAMLTENEGIDEAWAVFDHDGYTKHDQAFDLAKNIKPKVHIAFTSIAFEHWVLLHYERNNTAFPKSGAIIQRIRKLNYLKNYSKKRHFYLYKHTKPLIYKAFENTAWLRYISPQSNIPIYSRNPYCDVDKLVKKLLNVETEYTWVNLKKRFSIDKKLFFRVKYTGTRLCVNLNNHRDRSIKISDDSFKLYIETPKRNVWYKQEFQAIIDEHFTLEWDEIPQAENLHEGILHLVFENYHILGKLPTVLLQNPEKELQ